MRFALAVLLALPLGAQTCDRTCLREILDQYFAALVQHNPQAVPISSQVRFTEDGVEMPVGQGLWKTVSGISPTRQDVIDVRQSTVGSHATVLENGEPVQLVVRLKIFGLKIHEIETMVVRGSDEPKAATSTPALKTRTAAVDEAQDITWLRIDYGRYVAWEMHQIRDGRTLNSISKLMPLGSPSGWD